jgi:hypothetical protein
VNLAHGADSGPNIEALVLGAPLVVLGLALFFQKTANVVVPFVLIGAGAILSIGAFTFLNRDPHPAVAQGPGPAGTEATYAAAVEGLCLAQAAAADRDVDQARRMFQDRAHSPLHEIAADVGAKDRGAEGDLLVAMQRVEADLSPAGEGETLDEDLGDLIQATTTALDELGIPAASCAL